jgi:hypothetical protein
MRLTLLVCACTTMSLPMLGQNTTTSSKKAAGGADANIKSNTLTNPVGVKIAPPPSKGGPAAKGPNGTCDLHINNETGWNINFYFNGGLNGVVGAWGNLDPNITPGSATLYATALFTDGTTLTFGPINYQCAGGNYTWNLTP